MRNILITILLLNIAQINACYATVFRFSPLTWKQSTDSKYDFVSQQQFISTNSTGLFSSRMYFAIGQDLMGQAQKWLYLIVNRTNSTLAIPLDSSNTIAGAMAIADNDRARVLCTLGGGCNL
jgi:hypothetical protein